MSNEKDVQEQVDCHAAHIEVLHKDVAEIKETMKNVENNLLKLIERFDNMVTNVGKA